MRHMSIPPHSIRRPRPRLAALVAVAALCALPAAASADQPGEDGHAYLGADGTLAVALTDTADNAITFGTAVEGGKPQVTVRVEGTHLIGSSAPCTMKGLYGLWTVSCPA